MFMGDRSSHIDTAKPQPRTGGLAGVPGMVAAAATAFMLLTQPVGAQTGSLATATASVSLAKPEISKASKGKILLLVSTDFPQSALKFFSSAMTKAGLSAEISTGADLPSKNASFYIDGRLMELRLNDEEPTTQMKFSRIGMAAAAVIFYIQQNKIPIPGPVASL